jgi:hypothetical protein
MSRSFLKVFAARCLVGKRNANYKCNDGIEKNAGGRPLKRVVRKGRPGSHKKLALRFASESQIPFACRCCTKAFVIQPCQLSAWSREKTAKLVTEAGGRAPRVKIIVLVSLNAEPATRNSSIKPSKNSRKTYWDDQQTIVPYRLMHVKNRYAACTWRYTSLPCCWCADAHIIHQRHVSASCRERTVREMPPWLVLL